MSRFIVGIGIVMVCVVPSAWAHPGPLDACGGHTATERVEYPPMVDGTPTVPSEPGEYHFHLTPAQMEEAIVSLGVYRRTVREQGGRLDDLGSFTVGTHTYDILQYTRQQEMIVHCVGDNEVTHTGIIRIRMHP